MAKRREPFEIGEWYHCFNRGVEKRSVFESENDADRFLMLLYLANGTRSVGLFNIQKPQPAKIFSSERGSSLVDVGAYCLMPNHFHLLVRETSEGGVASFMQKLGTAYTMYFNAKYKRIGGLFLRPFRSSHVSTDEYFQHVLQYIHCNPSDLYEQGWKSGEVKNIRKLEEQLVTYPYSSLASYAGKRKSDPILSAEGFKVARHPSVSNMLAEAKTYYQEARMRDIQ